MAADLAAARRRFADRIADMVGVRDEGVREAFATVPRERFIGPPPWLVLGERGYERAGGEDLERLYDDVVVALKPDAGINNGQPSLHARCLEALAVRSGDAVLHVGCGTGYYSAILAELAGSDGHVIALDVVPDLVDAARANLAAWSTVEVSLRPGTEPPLPESDAIYVNAGATRPLAAWLDALRPGGRLVFPLTGRDGWGGILRVERVDTGYAAAFVCRCGFIDCEGARDDAEARGLTAAFAIPRLPAVRSLHRGTAPGGSCWFAGDGWWLSTDAPRA